MIFVYFRDLRRHEYGRIDSIARFACFGRSLIPDNRSALAVTGDSAGE